MMEVAAACASTAVTMAVTNLCAGVYSTLFANDEQKKRLLPPLLDGTFQAGAFALSEPGSGSDAASLRCKAVRDGDFYVIDGVKQWITSGDVAGVMILFARTGEEKSKGNHRLRRRSRYSRGCPSVRRRTRPGLRGSHTVPVIFEHARVPVANRLGEDGEGFPMAMRGLAVGRVGIASQAIGIARAALERGRGLQPPSARPSVRRYSQFQAIPVHAR